jgi:hypothetical protein
MDARSQRAIVHRVSMGILVRTIGTPAFIDRFAHALTKTNAGRASVDTFRAGASLPAALLTPDEALTDT